jgi:hypothetical protein
MNYESKCFLKKSNNNIFYCLVLCNYLSRNDAPFFCHFIAKIAFYSIFPPLEDRAAQFFESSVGTLYW